MAKKPTPQLQAQDIRNLQVFVAVVTAGGLTAAQSALGMSLPNISTSLASFERRFGITACHRGRAGFEVTEEGRALYEIAVDLLGRMKQAESEIARLGGHLSGVLTIAGHGGDFTHPEYLIPEAIGRFLGRAENHAKLNLEMGSQSLISEGVITGRIDIGIGSFPLVRDGVRRIALYSEAASLYCGRDHALFDVPLDEICPERLAAHDFVLRSEATPLRSKIPAMRVRSIAPTQEARALCILSGRLIGFLPDHVAHRWVSRGQMKRIGGPEMRYASAMEMIVKESSHRNALVEAFIADYAAAVLLATGRQLIA